jgi:hypothetical protein
MCRARCSSISGCLGDGLLLPGERIEAEALKWFGLEAAGFLILSKHRFVALLALCAPLPYLLGVRPRRQGGWRHVLVAIAFLMWLLLGFGYLHSR